ncbi:MAG: hydrogenase iron-sulfur subunit [Anaerolineaceae bacterium]|nr:hydrogenase iron-sulfur subunit [Anaerolineaceae bacterium]
MRRNPRIVLFQCQYCLASSADQDWVERRLPSNVKLVKVPCSGRISPLFILNAFQNGADGVLISGCMPEKCHFIKSNLGARRQLDEFKRFLVFLGLEPERFKFVWMDISERGLIQKVIADLTAELKMMKPNEKFNTLKGEIIEQYHG